MLSNPCTDLTIERGCTPHLDREPQVHARLGLVAVHFYALTITRQCAAASRKEAYMLATEARGFIADKTVGERMASIRRWNPEHESSEFFGFDEIKNEPTDVQQVIWDVDELNDHYPIAEPPGLLNRPMSV